MNSFSGISIAPPACAVIRIMFGAYAVSIVLLMTQSVGMIRICQPLSLSASGSSHT